MPWKIHHKTKKQLFQETSGNTHTNYVWEVIVLSVMGRGSRRHEEICIDALSCTEGGVPRMLIMLEEQLARSFNSNDQPRALNGQLQIALGTARRRQIEC